MDVMKNSGGVYLPPQEGSTVGDVRSLVLQYLATGAIRI